MKTIKLLVAAVFTFAFSHSGSAQLPVPGNYHGLFSETVGITHQSGGFIRVVVKPTGTFSGYLLVDGDRVAFTGKNFPTNVVTWSRTNKFGKEPLVVSLVANTPLESEQIVGTISNSAWVANVTAERQVWSLTNATTNFVNTFTFAFPGGTNAATTPVGDSVGWVTNNSAGFCKVAGFMADRSTMALKLPISTNNRVPFYVPAYRSRTTYSNEYTQVSAALKTEFLGSLMGWMTFTNGAVPTGDLVWIKTAVGASNKLTSIATNYYPAGFSMETSLVGSIYTKPSPGTWVLNLSGGSAVMQDGNLTSALTNSFTITNTVTTAKAAFAAPNTIKQILSFTPNTGRMLSAFYHPVSGLRCIGYLVPLQDQNIARGAFLGIDQSGSILIE